MSLRRSLRSRAGRDDQPSMDANTSARPTRVTRAAASAPAVTVHRAPSGLNGDSLRLTLKMAPNRLRDATGGSTRSGASTRRSVNVFTDNPIITGPRTSRPKKKLVEVDTSDEDDLEDQEEDEVDDEDAPGEDDEDVDADGDLDMDDAPPQPPVPRRHAKAAAAAAPAGKSTKVVEAKELDLENDEEEEEDDDDDDDDEELSELDSDAEGEPDDQDESMLANANGAEDLEEEDDLDSDDDTPTTDLTRMTKRQRGNLGNDFLQLPMEPQIKKHLTAEERAMRRAEMARRRKNLSEKRNEEEKMDTINRLLRKQAPKRRGRIPAGEAGEGGSGDQEAQEYEKADPVMVRWVSGREGSKVSVPEEWLGMPAGRVFGGNGSGKLVQEV
ncbi:PAPA-1-domain-containing protein [Aspergillus ellipticus CBS 707.79]|uniref:PAPA-1-domain-containing protein n=1 Tax=Aspergillus ellipticus CBS 707.79 TaxID=1448320 RepID=A0A319DPS8_9EURO|nr:PAPA-1-domain-containing protein [Aspergillus ellipticus CBS 707.79]